MKLKDIILGKSLNEAKSVRAIQSDIDKAVKKESTLSMLMLKNIEKYKTAVSKGDEKAVKKHKKIALDLQKKKKAATTAVDNGYKDMDLKISGIHADAELELKEANPDGTISPNEDKEMGELLDHMEEVLEDLFYEAEQETQRIGGQFRQPGYKSQVLKLVEKMTADFERGL